MRFAAFVAALFAAAPALAYNLSGQKWPTSQAAAGIPYYIDNAGSSPDVTNGSDVAAVKDAFSDWERVSCAFIKFNYAGHATTISSNDSKNVLKWINSNWQYGSSTLGVTTPVYWSSGPSAGQIFDADIVFNGQHYTWATSGSTYRTDVKSIALHEQGHFLGLNHSQYSSAVMYASYPGYVKATLTQDDINGVCAIYPAQSGIGRQGDPCSSDASCSSSAPRCAGPQGGGTKICTVTCSGSCPDGYSCQPSTLGENACLPTDQSGGGRLCDACQSAADCENGMCYTDGVLSICTQPCNTTTSPCPGGYTCEPAGTVSICWPSSNSCSGGGADCTVDGCPEGQRCNTGTKTCELVTSPLGGACEPESCQTGLICVGPDAANAYCRQPCSTPGSSAGCPADHTCQALSQGGGACLPNSSGGGGSARACSACGETVGCASDTECIAWSYGATNFPPLCRRGCNPANPSTCPVGLCLDFGTSAWCACPGEVAEYGESCATKPCGGGLVPINQGGCVCKWECDLANPACPPGEQCLRLANQSYGVCWPAPPPPDAGPGDAGPQDSGPRSDGGPSGQDSGPSDAGPRDSGPPGYCDDDYDCDVGGGEYCGLSSHRCCSAFTGCPDAGPADSGPRDGGGIVTAGDSGPDEEETADGGGRSTTVPRDGGGCACGPGGSPAGGVPILLLGALMLCWRRRILGA